MKTTTKHPQSKYEHHEIAGIYPMESDAEIKDGAESFQRSGQREDIVLFDGKILDGRNREAKCFAAGIEPRYRDYDPATDGPDPVRFVIDMNFERRQLTGSQRAAAATDALEMLEKYARQASNANLKQNSNGGGESEPDPAVNLAADVTGTTGDEGPPADDPKPKKGGRSAAKIAAKMGTSGRQVGRAKRVKDSDPEKFDEVKQGDKTLNQAEKEIKETKTDLDDPEFQKSREAEVPKLKKLLGDEFGEAFKNGTILKTKQATADFLAAKDEEKKQILPYVVAGWEPKKAVKFILRAVDAKDPISDLILRAANSGEGKLKVKVNGWDITLKLAKE